MKNDKSVMLTLITLDQAAERAGVDKAFIRRAIRNKELRVNILGEKTHRIEEPEFERWLRAKRTIGATTL